MSTDIGIAGRPSVADIQEFSSGLWSRSIHKACRPKRKEAAKRPKKIQRYSMMMLICIMIIYLVVLCTEVMSSLGAFFG